MAVVGIEKPTYTTDEDDEEFKICVNVTSPAVPCPVIFPFDLRFIGVPETAS